MQLFWCGGYCSLGDRVSLGIRNIINCHNNIIIGSNVNIAPDVKIYDHDHDFKKYCLSEEDWRDNFIIGSVIIGSNVWIGANTIILRDTVIGDNCVIGAGCVLKGSYPSNSVIIQERKSNIKGIDIL